MKGGAGLVHTALAAPRLLSLTPAKGKTRNSRSDLAMGNFCFIFLLPMLRCAALFLLAAQKPWPCGKSGPGQVVITMGPSDSLGPSQL